MSRPPILNLGIIGLPADWEVRYAPALQRLKGRVRIRSVFDPTPSRSDGVAADLQAKSFHGVRALLQSPQKNALLLADCGWQHDWALATAIDDGAPLFLGQNVLRSFDDWTVLSERLAGRDGLIVPECLLRYQPSMLRLRELMATLLGPVQQIEFDLPRARQVLDPLLSIREVYNWFRTTFEVVASRVAAERLDAERQDESVVAVIAPIRSGSEIRLHLSASEALPTTAPAADPPPFCILTSQAGLVELLGPRELRWRTENNEVTETLDADRSATNVALDLFARRAIGGLPPVPDLSHLAHAQRLADMVADFQ